MPGNATQQPPHVTLGKVLGGFCSVCESRIRETDQRQMDVLADIHAGRRAFIIGAGTSLAKIPVDTFDRLATEITFGVNFLSRWEGLRFRPTYWCVSEEDWLLPIEHDLAEWEERSGYTRTPRFFGKNRFRKELDQPPLDDYTRIHVDGNRFVKDGHLGTEIKWGCAHFAFSGYSVVIDCALQLALHMGCNPIYLLGVDADSQGHVYEDPGADNHPMKEDLRLGLIETVAQAAVILALRQPAVALVNASPGGKLEIPRVALGDLLTTES